MLPNLIKIIILLIHVRWLLKSYACHLEFSIQSEQHLVI